MRVRYSEHGGAGNAGELARIARELREHSARTGGQLAGRNMQKLVKGHDLATVIAGRGAPGVDINHIGTHRTLKLFCVTASAAPRHDVGRRISVEGVTKSFAAIAPATVAPPANDRGAR